MFPQFRKYKYLAAEDKLIIMGYGGSIEVDTLRPPTTLDKVRELVGFPNPQAFPSERRMQKEFAAEHLLRIGDIEFRGEHVETGFGRSDTVFKARVGLKVIRIRFPTKNLQRISPEELRVDVMTKQQAQEYARLLRAA